MNEFDEEQFQELLNTNSLSVINFISIFFFFINYAQENDIQYIFELANNSENQ